MNQSQSILNDLGKVIKSTLIYNPELRVFSSIRDDSEDSMFQKRIFVYIVENCNDKLGENKELRRLNDLNHYSVLFPKLKGFLLKNLKGYNRLK